MGSLAEREVWIRYRHYLGRPGDREEWSDDGALTHAVHLGKTLCGVDLSNKSLRDGWARETVRHCDAMVVSCRRFGVYLVLGHADPHKRKERHHMDPRSLGGSHDTANVITISGFLHALIHAGKIHLSGDANLRDQDGKFCGVAYDRMTEGGWKTERLV